MTIRADAYRGRGSEKGWGLKRIVIALAVLVLLALLAWFAVHLGQKATATRRGGRPSTTVGVAAAHTADIPITLDALGTVTPAARVVVTPQVSGVITQILFKEGQMVRRGEPLAVIDPRPLQMALMQSQGQLARDQAQLANAKLLLQRDQTLLTQDSIARQDVDTQAALVKQYEGVVTTDEAAVGTARLNLGYSRVVAPVAGRVGLRVVDVGNFINSGAANGIVVVTQVSPIDVEFTVPQDEIPRIQTQSAQGRLPVVALDRGRTITLDQGQFSTLDNQVDTTTGTVRAKARFPNAGGKLFPSQFVNVRLNLQPLKDAVVVPVTAVRTGPDGDFVWLLQADKTVTMRKVVHGPGTATDVAITQGLMAGDQVITEGGDRLTEGARVQLPGETLQPAGARRAGARGRRRPGAEGAAQAQGGGANGATPGAPANGGNASDANQAGQAQAGGRQNGGQRGGRGARGANGGGQGGPANAGGGAAAGGGAGGGGG